MEEKARKDNQAQTDNAQECEMRNVCKVSLLSGNGEYKYKLGNNVPRIQEEGKRMRQEEHRIQCAIVKWFYYAYPAYRGGCLFAVPNGGQRNIQTAARLKAEGVTSGVADLLLLVARHGFHGLCIEVKTIVGRQSENQKNWQRIIEAQGFKYEIVRSLDDFASLVRYYLDEVPKARLQGRLKL